MPLVDEEILTKVAAVFEATPVEAFTTADHNDHDGRKLAEDMYQVLISFQKPGEQLHGVDSQYPNSDWGAQWDLLSDRYRQQIEQVESMAIRGTEYILDFKAQFTDQSTLRQGDITGDVQRLKDWLNANQDDRGLKLESQQISQGFLDLSNAITGVRGTFTSFAAKQGSLYESHHLTLNDAMESLQAKISWEQSEAAEAEAILDGIVGGFAAIGGFFESAFTFGQSNILLNEAQERVQKHVRAAIELRQQKDQVAAQAQSLAKEESSLQSVRMAMSILAQDVIDFSGRLARFANMCAGAHSSFVELRYLLNGATTVHSATFLKLKIKVICSTSAVFAADMKAFLDAIRNVGQAHSLVAYHLSPQFGGSEVTKGALFNDARTLELDVRQPIVGVMITSGWVIDGIQVTYRLKNGQVQTVAHGTTGAGSSTKFMLHDNEYISEVTGKSGRADNGEPWMGDCVQQLNLQITNSEDGSQRSYGPFGTAHGLHENATTPIRWAGRLFAFAGRADNDAGQVGMRGIAFVEQA